MEQRIKPTEIRTESDTQLFVQIAQTETEDTSGKRREFVVAITLRTETGGSEDGEQTTFLNAHQIEDLIEELTTLRGKVIGSNDILKRRKEYEY